MAESVFNYERDVAPMRNNFFSDVARPAGGSRFTYATPDSLRYTAGVLAPAQAALRQAEEDERKRREEDLNFEYNRQRLEESKEESRMRREALEFVSNPEISAKLSSIDQKITVDPIQAQKELSDFTIKNAKGLSSSNVFADTISQLRDRINQAQADSRQKDADQFTRVKLLTEAGSLERAKQEAAKIKDSGMLETANILIEAQGSLVQGQQAETKLTTDQKQNKAKEDAERKAFSSMASDLKGMQMNPGGPPKFEGDSSGSLPSFPPIERARLKGYAKRLGVDPTLPDEELYQSIWDKVLPYTIDETTIGGSVGGVSRSMLPVE